jgi:hypothetical protein
MTMPRNVEAAGLTAWLLILAAAAYAIQPIEPLRRAWHTRRVRRHAWQTGEDLTAGLAAVEATPEPEPPPAWHSAPWVTGTGELPTVGTQPVCSCGGRRCRPARLGEDCGQAAMGERPAYWRRLPTGRHTLTLAAARWLAGDWWEADLPVRLRRELGRLSGAGTIPAGMS